MQSPRGAGRLPVFHRMRRAGTDAPRSIFKSENINRLTAMTDPYIPDYNEETCVVCGKAVGGGRGYCRLNHEGHMVELCCPLCLETFQKGGGIHDTIREGNRVLHPRRRKDPN